MTVQHPTPMTPLRARMIADISARNLGPASQTSHLRACKRFAAWLGRSPETATPDDVKRLCQKDRPSSAPEFLETPQMA